MEVVEMLYISEIAVPVSFFFLVLKVVHVCLYVCNEDTLSVVMWGNKSVSYFNGGSYLQIVD